jgi:glutaredoxin 3
MPTVRVYTTRLCAYCVAAKRHLDRKHVPYEEIDVSDDPDAREWLVEATGRRTVPQIFIGDRSIGGYTDLVELDRRGELDPLLAA